ncbi:MAG: hypothetical protein PUE83_09760 [Lachnobacterium sp.]|nr:hypothetical protein [Lachnobacterium sp.]
MKKKALTGILVASMLGMMLTGCGDNKEVTKTDDTKVEITTEKESEATETVVEETTEVETEAPTEEVKADFLAENGLTVTPNGSMTIPLAVTGTDDTVDVSVTTSVETVASSEEGYSDTTFTATMSNSSKDFTFYATAFDRYTGVDFEGKHTDFGASNGSTHQEVVVIDVDGKQYDCAYNADQSVSDGTTVFTMTIHHPSEYDGVVFQLGKGTKSIVDIAETIDYSQTFKITDYAGMTDGQYFFTATDK